MDNLEKQHEFFSWLNGQRDDDTETRPKSYQSISPESFDHVRRERNYYKQMFEKLVTFIKRDNKADER